MAPLTPWQIVMRGQKGLKVAKGCELSNGAGDGKTKTMRGGNENTGERGTRGLRKNGGQIGQG